MIYYTYGGKLSAADLKNNAKDIINACDKYGVVHLKLEAEAAYVKSTDITMDNFMDNLLYADSKTLALLKEAAMDFILENKVDIMGKVSFSNVPGDMMRDLLAAVARGEGVGDDSSDDDEEEDESIKYARMRVGTLRNMLLEKGLDMDGSRETHKPQHGDLRRALDVNENRTRIQNRTIVYTRVCIIRMCTYLAPPCGFVWCGRRDADYAAHMRLRLVL